MQYWSPSTHAGDSADVPLDAFDHAQSRSFSLVFHEVRTIVVRR
jgi:hypothetical protein